MTSPFLFTLWRFGWARDYCAAIGGWRRLALRLWWDLRLPPPAPLVVEVLPYAPPGVLHWSPDPTGMPLCGLPLGPPWTREFEHATCPACHLAGLPLVLQHEVNTR